MGQLPRFEAGKLIDGRYEILRELGRGERSRVFEALDRTGETVALKLIAPPQVSRPVASARLLAELRRLAPFDHPHAVRVLRGFACESGVGIAMQLVRGSDLAAHVAAHGALDAARAARLAGELARALGAAHALGLLHRDVKPSNVLLRDDGTALLGDFGCARIEGQALLAEVDEPVGTVAFLPPEVVAGRSPDPRSDLYALGLTLYFALTGRTPESARPGLPALPRADGHHPRELCADVPEWLDAVVARATRAQPRDRFATAQELCAALERRASGPGADPELLDVCVVCRQPGTLGRAVCPHCEDPCSRDDTLLVLERAGSIAECEGRAKLLAALSDQHAASPLLLWAAAGHLGLVRVSEAQARRIAQRLAAHGLALRRIPAEQAWRAVPRWVERLALGLVAAALVAAVAGSGFWLVSLLVLAGALPAAATALVENVTLLPRRAWPKAPPALVHDVQEVMPALESGEARHLLVDCLRLGRGIDERLARAEYSADGRGRRALAEALCSACAAARELATLDPLLTALQLHGPHRYEPPAGLLQCRGHVEQARAGLVQSLLLTTATLSQLRSQDVIDGSHCAAELAARAAELTDAQLHAAEQAKHGLALLAAR